MAREYADKQSEIQSSTTASRLGVAGMSFLVPGIVHFKSGHSLRGAIAFAVCVGLFLAGYAIVGDRLWFHEIFHPDPEGSVGALIRYFPITLLPEFANTGCVIVASFGREFGPTAERLWELPRAMEDIGFMLTGASGLASIFFAIDACWLTSGGSAKARPAAAAAMTWFLPGAAHVLWLEQKPKGLLLGGAVLTVFALGLMLSLGHAVDRGSFSAWWIAQSFCGVGSLVAAVGLAPMKLEAIPTYLDLGVVLAAVAGLMNTVLMVDAYNRAEQLAQSETPRAAAGEGR